MSSSIPDRLRTARGKWLVAGTGAAVAAAVAIGAGWGLASVGDDRPDSAASQPGGATTQPAGAATPTASGGTGTGSPAAPSPDQPGTQTAAPGSGGSGPRGPQIEYFRVRQEPLCRRGTTQYPIDGRPAVLEWRVTGAEQVTLSIDGPGIFDTYPAEGSETFSFACAGSEGDIEEHTYLLTVVAGGTPVTDTLVVTAEVHEVADVPAAPTG